MCSILSGSFPNGASWTLQRGAADLTALVHGYDPTCLRIRGLLPGPRHRREAPDDATTTPLQYVDLLGSLGDPPALVGAGRQRVEADGGHGQLEAQGERIPGDGREDQRIQSE